MLDAFVKDRNGFMATHAPTHDNNNVRGKLMSYAYNFNNQTLRWVYYMGTSNGAYIRANDHNSANWIYAKGEGLNSIVYLRSTKQTTFS